MEGGGGLSEDEVALLQQLPPGFRFHPTDEEIIMHYLLNKVLDRRFRAIAIADADLNKCEPWDLPKKAKQNVSEKEWYLFFQRDRKYPRGMRRNRATESGYWKATGKDKEIKSKKKRVVVVGMKKTLVFYKGRAPRGEKTNWVMHEYRLNADNYHYNNISRAAKEEFVVCRVFQKKSSPSAAAAAAAAATTSAAGTTTTHDDMFLQMDCPRLPPLTDVDYINSKNLFVPHNSAPIPNFHPLPTSMLTFSHPLFGYQISYPTNDPQNSRDILDHFSSNNLVISQSQETRLCTEYYQLANEITSKGDVDDETKIKKPFHDHQLEGLAFSPDISDLDSLWSY